MTDENGHTPGNESLQDTAQNQPEREVSLEKTPAGQHEPSPAARDEGLARQSGEHSGPGVSLDKEPEQTGEPRDLAADSAAVKTAGQQAAAGKGRFNACFEGLAKIGPLALLVALCCMTWPIFWQRGLGVYCPAEVESLTAFLHCLADGSWLAPTGLAGGAFTAAQWPAFSWLIGLLALSPGLVEAGYLLPTASFLCTFFAVLGVWCLSHSAGFGYRAAFAASLVFLCTPLFAPLPNFVGPATLSTGLLMFALVFFCRGWRGNSSWISLPVAFIFTAFAGLAGGFLPLIVPLGASVIYLLWCGKMRRSNRADALFGFVLLLLILGAWIGVLMLRHINDNYLALLFGSAWQWQWPLPREWLLPLCAGLLGCMPWLLMIFGVSWGRVFTTAGQTISESRHENGSALVWISLVLALGLALFIPAFHPSAVAIACLLCVLLGKAVLRLGDLGNRFFCLLAALCLIVAGCLILCLSFSATQGLVLGLLPELPVPDLGQMLLSLDYLPVIGALVLLGGICALIFVRRFSAAGPLIYAIALVIILCQPCRLGLVHELAKMPNTPLVSYAAAEARVADALAPAPAIAPLPPAEPAPQPVPDAAVPSLVAPDANPPVIQPEESAPQGGAAVPEQQLPYQIPVLPSEPPAEVIIIPEAPVITETPTAPAAPAQPENASPGEQQPSPQIGDTDGQNETVPAPEGM